MPWTGELPRTRYPFRVAVLPRLPWRLPCRHHPRRQGRCARWASCPRGVCGSPGPEEPRPCSAPISAFPTRRVSALYFSTPKLSVRCPTRPPASPCTVPTFLVRFSTALRGPSRFPSTLYACALFRAPGPESSARACVVLLVSRARARLAAGTRAFPAARALLADPTRVQAGRCGSGVQDLKSRKIWARVGPFSSRDVGERAARARKGWPRG